MFLRVPAVPRVGVVASSVALLLAAVLLIFPRLDDRYLWEDEAETALLARNVLRFGIPVAWDGRDLISQECGADHDANYLWRHTPWLPIYVTAASFKALGVDTFAARLPFAVLGLLALPSLYLLARLLFGDRATALLAVTCLLFSVPFLLHVRQDRYYSLAIFSTIWLLYFFFATLRGRRFAPAGLAVSLIILFQSNYLIAVATVAGLAAGLPLLAPGRTALARLAGGSLAALAVSAPWIVFLDLAGKTSFALSLASVALFVNHLGRYLLVVELHAFASLLLVPSFALSLLWRRHEVEHELPRLTVAACLGVVSIVHVLVLCLTPLVYYRYLVNLVPVFALLTAYIVRSLARHSRLLAGAVLAAVLLVDRADAMRLAPGSTVLKYVDEITHDFEGPIEAIVRYLKGAAAPGERVFISYGDLALRFYTDLEVRGGGGCQTLSDWPAPDWLVVRYFFRLISVSPGAPENARETVRALNVRLQAREYRHIELDTVDTVHDSIPEPDQHRFRTPRHGRRVTLFRRMPAPAGPSPAPRGPSASPAATP